MCRLLEQRLHRVHGKMQTCPHTSTCMEGWSSRQAVVVFIMHSGPSSAHMTSFCKPVNTRDVIVMAMSICVHFSTKPQGKRRTWNDHVHLLLTHHPQLELGSANITGKESSNQDIKRNPHHYPKYPHISRGIPDLFLPLLRDPKEMIPKPPKRQKFQMKIDTLRSYLDFLLIRPPWRNQISIVNRELSTNEAEAKQNHVFQFACIYMRGASSI